MGAVSPLRWPGSKRRLADAICARLPGHVHYVEVFGGSGAVLFAKPRSRIETFNDLDGDVVNLMRVIRDQPGELARALTLTPYSRVEFEGAREVLTDPGQAGEVGPVERARLFLVAVNQSVGRTVGGTGWSSAVRDHGGSTGVDRWGRLPERIMGAVDRLRGVQIDQSDWGVLLDRVDRSGTVLYLDPPYVPSVRAVTYRFEMDVADHERLVARLTGLGAAEAVVSGYDHPIYEPLVEAGWWRLELGSVADGPGGWDERGRREVLWCSPGCERPADGRLF